MSEMWIATRGKTIFLKQMGETECKKLFGTSIRADGIIIKTI
jgi:hypothetical protein